MKTLVGANAHAGLFGGLERFEQAVADEFLAHALAVVGDFDACLPNVPVQLQTDFSICRRGVKSILNDVSDDALKPFFVPARRHAVLDVHLQFAPASLRQSAHPVGNLAQVHTHGCARWGGTFAQLQHELAHTVE